MNLLVVINPDGQDIELGIEIDRMMKQLFWAKVKNFDFIYTKEVDNEDIDDLTSGIQEDIDAAATQAEWENVKYLYVIGGGTPKAGKAAK